MSIVRNNPFMEHFRGHIWKQIVVKHCGGQLVYSYYPDMRGVIRTVKQQACNTRFGRAVRFGAEIKNRPELWPLIRAAEKEIINLYKAAISVYMRYEEHLLSGKMMELYQKSGQIEGSVYSGTGRTAPIVRKRRFTERYLQGDFSRFPKHLRPPKEFEALFKQAGVKKEVFQRLFRG